MLPFDIRYSERADSHSLRNWLQYEEVIGEFSFSKDKEIDLAISIWTNFFNYKASLTGVLEKKPCAIATLWLMPYRKIAHHASFYIIVDPLHQKKGIGTNMVKNLLNLAKNYFHLESVHAEIFEGSPMKKILKKFSFEQFAYQEDFLKEKDRGSKDRGYSEHNYRARILMEHFF